MKNTLVIASIFFACATSAAGPAARSPREALLNYTKMAKEAVYGKAASAKRLNETSLNEAKKIIIEELKIPRTQQRQVMSALSGEAGALRMDNFITIIAAKKMSVELAKMDPAEAASIDKAADAATKLITNGPLVGAVKETSIKTLSREELSLVRDSLMKIETVSSEIIVNFSKGERDSYTLVLERLSELAETGRKSYEESFVDAIMEVRKVDKAKALEIVKKLKECV